MCVVSAVHGYFGQRQDLWQQLPGAYAPNTLSLQVGAQPAQWDRSTFEQYKDILKRLDALDQKLGQPDCVDPAKEAYMQEIENRLKALEQRA